MRARLETGRIGRRATTSFDQAPEGRAVPSAGQRLHDLLEQPYVVYPLSFVCGVIVWEIIARQMPEVVFASPSAVLAHVYHATLSGELPTAFAGALAHMVTGYVLALLVAVPLGFLMGRNEVAYQMFDPIVNAIFAIPSVGFVPFLIVWFGLFYEGRTALVFVMCVFDILVTVSAGARNIEPAMINVGRSFGARRQVLLFKVLMPASLPFLFTALRIGIVRAVNAMITAELFFAAVNLGRYMLDAANSFDSAGLLAVILLLALFGLALQEALKWLEPRVLPWHVRR